MSNPLTTDEAKQLIRLCESGKLYAIEEWIRSGKSLAVPKDVRKVPLDVAMSTGFHSLVELLLRHEESQQAKNNALSYALVFGRPAFVDLAIEYGAEVSAVPFLDVLLTGDRTVVASFIERGADPISGYPFARAFHELRVKTTLGSYLDCRRSHPHLAEALQQQADMALRQFCCDGNLKWVSLLMWAGADPRSHGPMLDDIDDPEAHTTALHEAAGSGKLEILKRLKPTQADDLAGMVERAAFFANPDILGHLLELGANPNDRPDGGSSALDAAIRYLGWEDTDRVRYTYGPNYQTPGHKVSKGREAIKVLLQHGAMWKPDPSTLNNTRRILYRIEPEVTLELISLLLKNPDGEHGVRELIRVPRMRHHLASCENQLARLGLALHSRRRTPVETQPPPSAHVMARYNRDTLYAELWRKPTQKVALRYGISDVALSKVCKQLRVPKPPRGYWAKKAAGRSVPSRPKLPPLQESRRTK